MKAKLSKCERYIEEPVGQFTIVSLCSWHSLICAILWRNEEKCVCIFTINIGMPVITTRTTSEKAITLDRKVTRHQRVFIHSRLRFHEAGVP